jgi:hypothetical protein
VIAAPVRIVQVAMCAEIHRRVEGPAAALAVLAARRGWPASTARRGIRWLRRDHRGRL